MSLRKILTVVLLLGIALTLGFQNGFIRGWTVGVQTALAQEDQPEQPDDAPDILSETPETSGDTTILTIASVGLVLIVMAGVIWYSRSQKLVVLEQERSDK
jgi:hypothetical protein